MTKLTALLAATLALSAACHHDVPPPSDTDDGSPPKPSTSHVGPTGPTANLVSGSHFAAYLLNPVDTTLGGKFPIGAVGELHVVRYDGADTKVADKIMVHNFILSPDGSALFYIAFDLTTGPSTGAADLYWLPIDKGAQPKLVAHGMPVASLGRNSAGARVYAPQPLSQESFFSASGHFLLVAVAPAIDARAPDLHIFDIATGDDIYQRPNGGAVYQQIMYPDDTLIFQDTLGGQSPDSPPVQTLYSVQLPGGQATTIMQRTTAFTPTVDLQKLVILDGAANLYLWDRTTPATPPKSIATGVVSYSVGFDSNGPIGYVGTDHSVHVIGLDGTKLADVAGATAGADFNGPPLLGTATDLYYWQNVETQQNRGTLFHLPVAANAVPAKLFDAVSLQDLFVTGDAIVFLSEVDDQGVVGQVGLAKPDGSSFKFYNHGASVPVGGLQLAQASNHSWVGLHIAGVVAPPTPPQTRDDSTLASGPLGLDDSAGNETIISQRTHAFRFSPTAVTIVFNDGARYDTTAQNWLGTLAFVDTYRSTTPVASNVTGVAEIGRIVARHFFASAPSAKEPGIYFVTY
jgi:hypothetical protein